MLLIVHFLEGIYFSENFAIILLLLDQIVLSEWEKDLKRFFVKFLIARAMVFSCLHLFYSQEIRIRGIATIKHAAFCELLLPWTYFWVTLVTALNAILSFLTSTFPFGISFPLDTPSTWIKSLVLANAVDLLLAMFKVYLVFSFL